MIRRIFTSTRSIGTILAACVAALATFAATTTSAAPTKQAHSAGKTAGCKTSQLVLWLDTQGNGAAGSTFYELKLTNLSKHRCALRGYPGVSAVDLKGHRLGRPASREHVGNVKSITLRHGQTATATLRIVQAGNFPSSTCRQTTAAGLRVYPPGQTKSKVIPFPFAACSHSGPTYLSVRAVHKG